ncbi:hypothetical protein KBI23_01585 [bacterium]|nr:hypothetical protein [bacterium]MBP9807034.1 hypothetical protein [bacterium]
MKKEIGISLILRTMLCSLSIVSFLWAQPTLSEPPQSTQALPKAPKVAKKIELLLTKLKALLLEFYPQSTFTKKPDGFECRFNTRTFLIHHALKTGEWQEARAQEGPNRGGILCSVTESAGRYAGAAMVPQQFEYRYFSCLLMAPYNKNIDRHLIAHLYFPDNVKPQLLKRFNELITSFAQE